MNALFPSSRRARGALLAAVAVASGVGLFTAYATGNEPRDRDRGGLSAGVSAMKTLPPAKSLPPDVARWVERSARDIGNDPTRAKTRVRKLRGDLGTAHSDLYAYAEDNGAICFDLTSQAAACAAHPNDGPAGIDWFTGGGWASVPRNVVALVSDDVVRVVLAAAGTERTVPIVDNSIFAELPSDDPAELQLEFRDGSKRTVTLPGANG